MDSAGQDNDMGLQLCSRAKFLSLTQIKVLMGIVFLHLPGAIPLYYGNLSVYLDSYFLDKEGIGNYSTGSLWIPSALTVTEATATLLSGFVIRKIGLWNGVVFTVIGFNISLTVSYFTVQSSFLSITISLGALAGLFDGFHEAVCLVYAANFFPENVGLATAIACSSYAIGAIAMNLVITIFLNPQHKAPTLHLDSSTYFTDEDILNRVPYLFLILGGISSVFQIVAVILLNIPPRQVTAEIPVATFQSLDHADHQSNEKDAIIVQHKSICVTRTSDKTQRQGIEANGTDFTTWEALKTPRLYIIALLMMPLPVALNVVNSYYKEFGMRYIQDDYFLTFLGVMINITVGVFRFLWGGVVDYLGPESSIILYLFINTILSVFWYFTPMVNAWLFVFWTLALVAGHSALYTVFAVLTLKSFGKTYYVSNYGVVMMGDGVLSLIAPPLISEVLASFGYFWVLLIVAASSALGLIVAVSVF